MSPYPENIIKSLEGKIKYLEEKIIDIETKNITDIENKTLALNFTKQVEENLLKLIEQNKFSNEGDSDSNMANVYIFLTISATMFALSLLIDVIASYMFIKSRFHSFSDCKSVRTHIPCQN